MFEFTIIHRQGRLHANVDAISRPVLMLQETDDTQLSNDDPSHPDVYDDQPLLYFLKYRRHKSGVSEKTAKRVEKLSNLYQMDKNTIFYRRTPHEPFNRIVPPKEERDNIITYSDTSRRNPLTRD
jgi:hypothetical protein